MSEEQLKSLISEGENIYTSLGSGYYSSSSLKSEYESWLRSVTLFFYTRNDVKHVNPFNSYVSRMWSTGSEYTFNPSPGTIIYKRDQIRTYSLTDIMNIISNQIDFLKGIRAEKIDKLKEKAFLIEKKGLIKNKLDERFCKYNPNHKVFKFIWHLVREGDYIKTDSLLEKTKLKNLNALSNAKRAINRHLFEKIGVRDFILEGERTNGYRINPQYLDLIETK